VDLSDIKMHERHYRHIRDKMLQEQEMKRRKNEENLKSRNQLVPQYSSQAYKQMLEEVQRKQEEQEKEAGKRKQLKGN